MTVTVVVPGMVTCWAPIWKNWLLPTAKTYTPKFTRTAAGVDPGAVGHRAVIRGAARAAGGSRADGCAGHVGSVSVVVGRVGGPIRRFVAGVGA